MNTKLIYTNKGSSVVKNEITGEFISEVASSIVNAGDAISVEAIAVSTTGTGADVIEIPRQVRNYLYKTNEIAIEFMYYIHANFEYSCVLPLATSGGTGGQQNIYTTLNQVDYGYLDPDIFVINHNQDYQPKNVQPTYDYAGQRLYIGSFGDDGDNPRNPVKSTTINDPDISPGKKVFNFLTTTIPIKVDYGYNSPANLTSKITYDLHNAMFTPNKNNELVFETPTNYYEPNLSYTPNPTTKPAVLQATATSRNSSCETIFGVPNQYYGKTASSTNPYWYGTYSNLMAVKNPFYWYWGSRLTAQEPNGVDKALNWLIANIGGTNGTNADIVNLNIMRNEGINTTIQRGDVLVTNLKWDEKTIYRLSKLIHSEKLNAFNFALPQTQETMIKNKAQFYTRITIGKYNDGGTTPYASLDKLQSKYLSLVDTAPPLNVNTPTFFNEKLYDDSIIAVPTTDIGITEAGTLNINGVDLTNKQVAQYYDINICRVVTRSGAGNEDVIGIILQAQTINGVLIRGGNFCVCDLTTSRDQAHAHMILSPDLRDKGNKHTLADVVKGFNIGGPNINLAFDSDRSKFAWRNMYWSNYVGNPLSATDANPDANQEVITINKFINDENYYKPAGTTEMIYTQYAQCGLGFYNLYVYDNEGNAVLIDRENFNLENELKEKYESCLLKRMGFEYGDLFNTFGLANVFYQERFQFNNLPTTFPQYFPYPLTCNPEVDTAFNQSINVNDHSLPTFNLSLERNSTNINVAVQTAEILARNKPQKLATPYWLIESDIIDAMKYTVDGNPRNIMAVCNRAYGSGDIVYSFAQDYKFIATKSFVISHIKTNILTSDLLPADVDDATTIIYKIESPVLPNFLTENQLMQEMEEEKEEGKKK